jgi:hypothetical protein
MNSALVIEVRAPCPARWTSSQVCPFFIATSAATIAHISSATWIGPSSASSPNSASDPAIRIARVTSGMIASAREGVRIGRSAPLSPSPANSVPPSVLRQPARLRR